MKTTALGKIKNSPKFSKYHKLCFSFLSYLRDKENLNIVIMGYDTDKEDVEFYERPYMHRWKPEYMKARLAKLYKLEEWANQHPLPVTMLSFTTYHDSLYARRSIGRGYSIEDSWAVLKVGFRKSTVLIRNKIRKNVPYLWVVEPQPESGYPHIHAGFFTEFTDYEQKRLQNHWANVVKAGSFKHGLEFSFDKTHKPGEIFSMRNYLMKYMAKTFVESIPDWSPEELVFNAIALHDGYRLFGSSNDLAKVMERPKQQNSSSFIWFETSTYGQNLSGPVDVVINKNPNVVFS
jgi:hypothetical protein